MKLIKLLMISLLSLSVLTGCSLNQNEKQDSSAPAITKDKAIQIVLSDAGLSQDQVKDLKIESDKENGIEVYEVEFDYNGQEYHYDLRKDNGNVLKKSVDPD